MVYKAFSHLTRQNLVKALTNSSGQPIVTFAHSSTSQGPFSPSFGLSNASSRLHHADSIKFHSAYSSSNNNATFKGFAVSDAGLSGYFVAWQSLMNDDKEWSQYHFANRIGWLDDKKSVFKSVHAASQPRSQSASRVEELPDDYEEAVAATESEPEVRKSESTTSKSSPEPESEDVRLTSEAVAEPFLSELVGLREQARFAEVAAVFDVMVAADVRPPVLAYEILLEAAIASSANHVQLTSTVLSIYTDMLRKNVPVSPEIYDRMLGFLAARSVAVHEQKTSLETKRARYGGMTEVGTFLLPSNEVDFDTLVEDDSFEVASRILSRVLGSKRPPLLSAETYVALIKACGQRANINDIVRITQHMDAVNAPLPVAAFVPMISALAGAGDLFRSEEVYRTYVSMVSGKEPQISLENRRDPEIHAALIKAFMDCQRHEQAERFFERVLASLPSKSLQALHKDAMIADGMLPHILKAGDFQLAHKWADEIAEPARRQAAFSKIATVAADAGKSADAVAAFARNSSMEAKLAVLAMHIRQQNFEASEPIWTDLCSSYEALPVAALDIVTMMTLARIHTAPLEEVLHTARQMWMRIRQGSASEEVKEQIDEAVEFYGNHMFTVYPVPSSAASMELMWTMIENGGLVSSLADTLMTRFGPEAISQLSWQETILLLQIQAGIITRMSTPDLASTARYAQLFEMALSSGVALDERTCELLEQSLDRVGNPQLPYGRPDLAAQWRNYLFPQTAPISPVSNFTQEPVPAPFSPVASAAPSFFAAPSYAAPSVVEDNHDPHHAKMDFRGSAQIAEELERGNSRNSASHLNEALIRFRNIRRAGRHPRYITYAKLITAAAKENKMDLVRELVGLAQQDVPLLPEFKAVRYGWVVIFDAMVAACLNLGDRQTAMKYHQELRNIGAAPSANTFGLYITTMKESVKTNDEATEAVSIFRQAKLEGVEPTSFLYNALIGKLGKARRIDDCLYYFNEMRSLGVKPTSVTYGTMVNALCRVSDEKFAESIFEEMESQPNYKPRAAPYNSMIQFFLTTKRDRTKALAYYERMRTRNITPTSHTYKLLIDVYATLQPVDLVAAEGVLNLIKETNWQPEAVHYASLIHAKGCVNHDVAGAREMFDRVFSKTNIRPQPCLYQALFEGMVAAHQVAETEPLVQEMRRYRVEMTPYIANTLIRGWAHEHNIEKAEAIYATVDYAKREPSLYDAMTRAYLAVDDREKATEIVNEMLSRGYPSAVSGKLRDLVTGQSSYTPSVTATEW